MRPPAPPWPPSAVVLFELLAVAWPESLTPPPVAPDFDPDVALDLPPVASAFASPPVALELPPFEVEVAPEFAPSYRSLGVVYLKSGQYAAAQRNLEHYLELAPEAPDRKYAESYLRIAKQKGGEP